LILNNKRIEEELKKSSLNLSLMEFKRKILIISLIFFLLLLGVMLLFDLQIIFSFLISLIISIIIYFLLLLIPLKLNEWKAKKIEALMPFVLLELSVLLKLNVLPEKALEIISKKKNAFCFELRKAIKEKLQGKSIHEALKNTARKINSIEFKSFISTFLSIIESNKENKEEIIKGIALNLFEKQKTKEKEFSSKAVIYSLLFIVFAALMPAFLLAFIVVGSFFIEIQLKAIDVFLLITILFPLINSTILLMLYFKMPETLKG